MTGVLGEIPHCPVKIKQYLQRLLRLSVLFPALWYFAERKTVGYEGGGKH
jgi:hypothetical protein